MTKVKSENNIAAYFVCAVIIVSSLVLVSLLTGCEATRGLINGLGQDINRIVR